MINVVKPGKSFIMKILAKGILYFLLTFYFINNFLSCKKANKIICGPCPALVTLIPHIRFRVVDKMTGLDLFFGISAKYKPTQIQTFHYNNGRLDTLYLGVDTTWHTFFLGIVPIHHQDTVSIQIANLSKDSFLFNTKTVDLCCPNLILDSVTFNNSLIYTKAKGPDVVVLFK